MKRLLPPLFILFLLLPVMSTGQIAKFKALFIYNFTKNIAWPNGYDKGNFVIGILGNSDVEKELKKIAQKKRAGSQSILIKHYQSVSQIGKCHILYIPEDKHRNLKSALAALNNQPTLVVTDNLGMAKYGAGISFFTRSNKLAFEISKKNIEGQNLLVGQSLLSLGARVD